MTAEQPIYALDSFALLALIQDEPSADQVEHLLRRAKRGEVRLALSVVSLGEIVYRSARERGFDHAQDVLTRLEACPIDIVDADRHLALAAARVKATYRMSYADCFVVALAQRLGAAIVTGDPDFHQVENLVTVEWLPTS